MQPPETRTRTPRHLTTSELQDFVRSHPWKYARTMPAHPHDYLLRTKARDEAEFERAARTIRETGFVERYGSRDYTVLDVEVDGVVYKLWTMGAPIPETKLINRCVRRLAVPESFRQMVELQATAVRNMQAMIAPEPDRTPPQDPDWYGGETDRSPDCY